MIKWEQVFSTFQNQLAYKRIFLNEYLQKWIRNCFGVSINSKARKTNSILILVIIVNNSNSNSMGVNILISYVN